MTVLELCTTNLNVTEIDIDLRDEKGRLIRTYRIGKSAREYPGDSGFEVVIINEKEINYGETLDAWGLIEKNVPKDIGALIVDQWMTLPGPIVRSKSSVRIKIHAHDGRPMFGGST